MKITSVLKWQNVQESYRQVLKHNPKFCSTFGDSFSFANAPTSTQYEYGHSVTRVNQNFIIKNSHGKEAICTSEIALPNRIRVYELNRVFIKDATTGETWDILEKPDAIDVEYKRIN